MSIKTLRLDLLDLWVEVGKDTNLPKHIRQATLQLLQIIHDYIVVEQEGK